MAHPLESQAIKLSPISFFNSPIHLLIRALKALWSGGCGLEELCHCQLKYCQLMNGLMTNWTQLEQPDTGHSAALAVMPAALVFDQGHRSSCSDCDQQTNICFCFCHSKPLPGLRLKGVCLLLALFISFSRPPVPESAISNAMGDFFTKPNYSHR